MLDWLGGQDELAFYRFGGPHDVHLVEKLSGHLIAIWVDHKTNGIFTKLLLDQIK